MEVLEVAGPGPAVLHVAGRVNSANAADLGARLFALLDRGCRAIVLDLSHLVHMTSAGFRALLRADKAAGDAGGVLVVCGVNGLTLELFEIGGFLEMLNVAGTREEAISRANAALGA